MAFRFSVGVRRLHHRTTRGEPANGPIYANKICADKTGGARVRLLRHLRRHEFGCIGRSGLSARIAGADRSWRTKILDHSGYFSGRIAASPFSSPRATPRLICFD
jgi:hypothetical protein